MNAASIFDFFKANQVLATLLVIILIGVVPAVFRFLRDKLDFYIWYLISILLVLGWAFQTDNPETQHMLYFYAFMLGMLTAFAEIIGKFSDEPIKSLSTWHALFYHLLNGAISAFALFMLKTYGTLPTSNQEKLELVILAGLGSMLVMRSKLLNLKIGGQDVALGPEQIINVFFRFMESEIDRIRAQTRIDFVRERLYNVDFDKVRDYSVTMLRAAQALDTQEKCKEAIKMLDTEQFGDKQMKSYALGFLLLNKMGENFVDKLFDKDQSKRPMEWRLSAPLEVKEVKEEAAPGLLGKLAAFGKGAGKEAEANPGTEEVYYMAYGTSMCSRSLRARLNWSLEETEFAKKTDPKVCLLKSHRLVFNKPDNPDETDPAHVCGLANIEPTADGAAEVEGVLYKLPRAAIEFLDHTETGYRRKTVDVQAGGQTFKAEVYQAEITRPNLSPELRELQTTLDGAREHHLSAPYIERLEALKATAVESVRPDAATARDASPGNDVLPLDDTSKAVIAATVVDAMTKADGTTPPAS
ncbi:MAG TPA: gamma-glutamylcyclotransferase [Pyrinomonadaceae bacterium]|nr:gamma-glutamylcyclotransferase [Pyrinomonadaceae bacterium]